MTRMDKSLESVKSSFSTVRTGRANPSMVDRIEASPCFRCYLLCHASNCSSTKRWSTCAHRNDSALVWGRPHWKFGLFQIAAAPLSCTNNIEARQHAPRWTTMARQRPSASWRGCLSPSQTCWWYSRTTKAAWTPSCVPFRPLTLASRRPMTAMSFASSCPSSLPCALNALFV